jgi:catechol 2,3-dioxygenase-like lactoylglutathione lyase family enzyme
MTPLQGALSISITASDLAKSLHFYTEGLGFRVDERFEDNGELHGVMLSAGEARIGLSQDDFAKGRERRKGIGLSMYIETAQDLHELAKRAEAAGIALDGGVAPLPWGPLAFRVTDPDGFAITLMSRESK